MRRRYGAVAAASLVAALGLSAAADAQIRVPFEVPGIIKGEIKADPKAIADGRSQPGDVVSGVTCPSTQGIATGLGTVLTGAEQLGPVGCVIGSLDLQFATRLGTISRTQPAAVNVPTPLNVDADPQADVIGTVRVLSLSRFELTVERATGEASELPLKIEALVDSPMPGALPRQRINVGYDARAAQAPERWTASAELPAASPGTTVIDVRTAATNPGASLKVLGGLFDGPADERVSPMGGALNYAPVPPEATLGLTLGPKMAVRAGAKAPDGVDVELDGTAEIVDGLRRRDVTVGLNPLPEDLQVTFEEPGVDKRKVTYWATSGIDEVDATYTDSTAGVTTTKVVANAEDLPTDMTVEQTGARSGTFTATGGDLGVVEAGFANGEPKLLDEDNPYAYVTEDDGVRSFAGRIDDLRSATIDADDGVSVDVQLGGTERHRLHGVVSYGGKEIDATISDLPRHIDFSFTPGTGVIDYDAHGEEIEKITAKAVSDVPWVDRATRIEGTIEGLPPAAHVKATPGTGGFSLKTDASIDKADVLLSSGPDGGLAAGEIGADVRDLPTEFVAHARVEELKEVAVDITKQGVQQPDGSIKQEIAKVGGTLKLAPRPTVVRYDSFALDVDTTLSSVPSDVKFWFDKNAGSLTYDADAPIDEIVADVDSTIPMFGDAKTVDATVKGLPSDVTVGLKPASGGTGAAVTTTAAVDMVEARITDGTTAAPELPEGASKVALVQTEDAFAVAARLFEVNGGKVELVEYAPDPAKPHEKVKRVEGDLHLGEVPGKGKQDVDIYVEAHVPEDAVPGDLVLSGKIVDVPTDVWFKLDGNRLDYDASDKITRVDVNAQNLPQGKPGDSIAGKPLNVKASIHEVPKVLDIDLQDIEIKPVGDQLGRVDFELWDTGGEYPSLPEDGRNKLLMDKRNGRMHVQGRLQKGLVLAKLGLPEYDGDWTSVTANFAADPAPLDVAMDGGTDEDPSDVDVRVRQLSTEQTLHMSDAGGLNFHWKSNRPGTDVDLDVSSKDVGSKLTIGDLPRNVQACVGGDRQCVSGVKRVFRVNDKYVEVPTSAAIKLKADGVVHVDGEVCLPPSNGDGERQGDVYGACLDGTSKNRVWMDRLSLVDADIGVYSGDTLTRNGKGDGPEEDELLKLHLRTDPNGIRARNLWVINDLTEDKTKVRVGWIKRDDRIVVGGKPLRSEHGNVFELLADLSFPPNAEHRRGRMECDSLEVKVELFLGIEIDVLPFPGEAALGDICID